MKLPLKIFLTILFLAMIAIFAMCIPENVKNLKLARYWFLNLDTDGTWYVQCILEVCSNFLGILLCAICTVGVFILDRVIHLYKNSEYLMQKKQLREEKYIEKLTQKQKEIEQKLNNLKEDRE